MPKLKNSIVDKLTAEGKVSSSQGPNFSYEKLKELYYKQKIQDRKYFPNNPETVLYL